MTASLTTRATRAASPTVRATPARRAGWATRRTVSMLGGVVALAGVEHGVGEMLQGGVAPEQVMILSWPESDAFSLLGGEPAMTVVPNLLITGILAILASLVLFAWATLFIHRRHAGVVLMALSVVLLLVGGGIAPPAIGLALGFTATRIHTPVRWWRTRPAGRIPRMLARAWPSMLAMDVVAFLSLFPGVVLLGALRGSGAVPEAMAYALMVAAFVFLPLSLVAALAAEALTGATDGQV